MQGSETRAPWFSPKHDNMQLARHDAMTFEDQCNIWLLTIFAHKHSKANMEVYALWMFPQVDSRLNSFGELGSQAYAE